MSVNKVTAFGENLIDLTEDTVTKDTLIKGVTAHDASGNSVTGTFDPDKYLEKAGDASNTTAVFSASKERANISTGEKLSVIFGKIAKFFSDLKTVAFTGNYSDLSGTPSVVSKTADGLCPKNGGTTTKFLRDDGTYAVPTSSVIGLSTLEQVTAAATAGNVTAPVGAGALAEVNSSLIKIEEILKKSVANGSFTPSTSSTTIIELPYEIRKLTIIGLLDSNNTTWYYTSTAGGGDGKIYRKVANEAIDVYENPNTSFNTINSVSENKFIFGKIHEVTTGSFTYSIEYM